MMKKGKVIGFLSVAVMVAMVAVLSVGTQTQSNACLFKKTEVNIYTGNENADGFEVTQAKIRLSAKNLVKTLKKNQAVATDVKVKSFKDNGEIIHLDLNQAYADDVSSSGTAGEYIKIGSVVNTFLDAYDASMMTITVEGKAWETGHNVYDESFKMFPVNQGTEPEVQPEDPEVEPEVQPESTTVELFVGNDNADGFNTETVEIEEITADALIKALVDKSAIASDVAVCNFVDNGNSLALDLNMAFQNDLNMSGTAGEYIKLGAVVNTFLAAFEAQEITLTVEGAVIETGHNVYEDAFTMFN